MKNKLIISILLFFLTTFSFSQKDEEQVIDSINVYVKITFVKDGRSPKIFGVACYKNKDINVYNMIDYMYATYSLTQGLTIYRKVYIIKQTIDKKTTVFGRTYYSEFLVNYE